tara:strand:+ start:8531 stop:8764 length:234 start_codon:yes stop_codon:yes gene_type:complete
MKNEKFLTFFFFSSDLQFFLLASCSLAWEHSSSFFYSAFLPLSPLLPLFLKNKNSDSTQLLPLALFADSIKSSQKQR